jgi:hypothetical protein
MQSKFLHCDQNNHNYLSFICIDIKSSFAIHRFSFLLMVILLWSSLHCLFPLSIFSSVLIASYLFIIKSTISCNSFLYMPMSQLSLLSFHHHTQHMVFISQSYLHTHILQFIRLVKSFFTSSWYCLRLFQFELGFLYSLIMI